MVASYGRLPEFLKKLMREIHQDWSKPKTENQAGHSARLQLTHLGHSLLKAATPQLVAAKLRSELRDRLCYSRRPISAVRNFVFTRHADETSQPGAYRSSADPFK
jgi:hypothetical protein